MKKLLVLLLVLGLSSVASAAITDFTLETDGSKLYVTGIAGASVPTYSIADKGGIVSIDVPGTQTMYTDVGNGGANTYLAGDLAAVGVGVVGAPIGNVAEITAGIGPTEGDSVDAGLWFDFSVTASLIGYTEGQFVVGMDVYDAQLNNLGSKDVTYIPEPMTIALLGLGGLLLRRRK